MNQRFLILNLAAFSLAFVGNVAPAATYDVLPGRTTNLSSALTGAEGLTKTGAGTLIVSGASNNTYTGWTSINSGALVAAKSGALGRITEGTIVESGASLFLSNNISIAAESLFLSGTGVGGSGALGNSGGTNRYQGPISLLAASRISSTTGTLALGTTVNAAGFELSFSNSAAASIIAAGSIDGIGSTLTKLGAGTLVLQADNNYDGTTTITGGAIRIADGGSLGTTAAGTSVASGAALELSNNITVGTEALSLSGSGIGNGGALRNISGSNTYQGVINAVAARVNSDAGTLTLSGAISASGESLTFGGSGNIVVGGRITRAPSVVVKDGAGTVTLMASNSLLSSIRIDAGTLEVVGGFAISDFVRVVFSNSSAAALLVSKSETIGSLSSAGGDGPSANVSIASEQTLTLAATSREQAFAGQISGPGSLMKTNGGRQILTGANTFTGGTTLASGSLLLGNDSALGTGRVVILGGVLGAADASTRTITNPIAMGGDVTLGGADFGATGSLVFSNVDLSQAARTFDVRNHTTIAGAISDGGALGGSLTKAGSGTMTLSGHNSHYTGGTSVSAGALIVDGTSSTGSGVLTVSAGATLGGVGSIAGATIIGGIHSPGASPGVQTFLSDLTYEDLSSVSWELISNISEAPARGIDYDGVNVGGNLAFNGNVALDLSFNSAGSSVDWNDPFWGADQSWVLYQVGLSTTGEINLQLNPGEWLDAIGNSFEAVRGGFGSAFSVIKSGNDVHLNYSSVPEPSTYALLLMTGAGALWWARRRR